MAKQIKQSIVGYKVKKDDEQVAETAKPEVKPSADIVQMHESVKRPEMLLGSTYKVKTPLSDHALYMTINDIVLNQGTEHELRRPFEIFINFSVLKNFLADNNFKILFLLCQLQDYCKL